MCITFFCLFPYGQTESSKEAEPLNEKTNKIKFIIAFNRDEQCFRRTLKMGPFEQDANIFAGRDLKSTGTWLGINIKTGIMVVLTNYDLIQERAGKSRGKLVKSFLKTDFIESKHISSTKLIDQAIEQKLTETLKEASEYSAFNLMVYNIKSNHIYYICSELGEKKPKILQRSTFYGLCNTDLNTIWPKTEHGLKIFEQIVKQHRGQQIETLFDSLSNKLMRDSKRFSNNLADEAAIFIQPFYSTLYKARRMTKSTFVAAVIQKQNGENEIIMRQITHKDPTFGKNHHYNTRKNEEEGFPGVEIDIKQFDHFEETTVNFRFPI